MDYSACETHLGLTKENADNFLKLGTFLLENCVQIMENETFNMKDFSYDGYEPLSPYYAKCGTVCCAAGHGPQAGIEARSTDYTWYTYLERNFISGPRDVFGSEAYAWCFLDLWESVDNTPYGAALRILYMLENPEAVKDFIGKTNFYSVKFEKDYPFKDDVREWKEMHGF